ncbi:GNAT family protein [Raoultella planticola]|uniref:hypothetical protein n=1 Tax=Raoultella planticola TaxID=575 RepID=UPI003977B355
MEELISAVPHLIFGNVLFYAIRLALLIWYSVRTVQHGVFDVPNGGVDPKYSAFSPAHADVAIFQMRATCAYAG